MNTQTTSTGSTGFGLVRSLLAFRRRNAAARGLSTFLALAIAMLLVVGTGPAYADDPAPTDESSATTDATPAGEETTEPAPSATPTGEDTPAAEETEPAGEEPEPTPEETEQVEETRTPTTTLKSQQPITAALEILALASDCFGTGGTIFGNFEIDGNTCVDSPVPPAPAVRPTDWDTPFGSKVEDHFEPADTKGFTGGSSKVALDPAGWLIDNDANTKADVKTAWAGSRIVNGNVFTYFAFERHPKDFPGANGDVAYHVEYNQLPNQTTVNGLSVPHRSPGDLMLIVNQSGSSTLSVSGDGAGIFEYKAGHPGTTGCFVSDTADGPGSWCPKTPGPAFKSAVNAESSFGEAALDITALFGPGTCSGSFGVINMRSSSSTETTSAMQDYIAPINATTPSTCGKIIINKDDENGADLGGATFSVSPNPIPGTPNATPYSITDNDPKDKNPANGVIEISPVDPGDAYTVTETSAPTGYMIDNPLGTSTNPQTVGTSETKTFNFVDHRIWKNLTATKSATTSYRADYAWSVNKEISPNGTSGWTTATTPSTDNGDPGPLQKNVAEDATDADNLFYRVTVTEGARTTSQYKVSGTIRVSNPADNVGTVNAVVTDEVPGATCLVDGLASKAVAVPKGGYVDVPYVCTFAGVPTLAQLDATNTAHVTWDRATYPQQASDLADGADFHVDPTADYDFADATVTEVDKTVTVTDNQHTFDPAWTITWNDQDGVNNTSSVYSQTLSVDGGTCSAVFANTATVTGNGVAGVGGDDHTVATDSAYGRICQGADLTITRIDARGFTRTFPWAIEKATTTPKVVVTDGQATAQYDVTVTAGDGTDTDWTMTGSITVHNPNDWESVSVTSLPVTYSGGGTCTATGPFPYVLTADDNAAGGTDQHAFSYSCNFGGVKPSYSGSISATANWSQAAASTPDDHVTDAISVTEADWTKTLVNDTVTVVDDNATPADTADDTTWELAWEDVYAEEDPDHQTVLSYSIDLAIPDGGTCAVRTNTVKIVGDEGAELDSDENAENNSAAVNVCNPLGLSVTKTAEGDFTRTYPWTIEKFINGDQTSQEVHVDAYSHSFDYKVVVTPGEPVDTDWVVSGVITVTNDNTDDDIDPIALTGVSDLPDVGAAGVCAYTPPGVFPISIDSGDSIDVGYECTFENQPTKPYAGTNTATATWGQTGTDTSDPVDVSWNDPTEVDKSIDVFDDKVDQDPAEKLGTAVWNEAGTAAEFTYSKEHTAAEQDAGSCAPGFVNTAWLGGTAAEPTELKDSTTATICVNAGTWTVSKVNVDGDGPVPTDSDVTYRLTAHKTGGVNPKDVVLLDDLSDLVPHIEDFVPPAAPAGTTVEYDATDHVLTWTIDELTSTDRTLEFTVHVKADAYGVDLPNLVTSPGSSNCPDEETAGPACETDNDTPHYTLEKSSDAGAEVLPPYLGDEGTLITYTLTVHNDSDAPINATTLPGATVTDDLTDVLDDAEWVGNLSPAGQAVRVDNTLTWTLPEIPVDGTATLTYQVRVAGDQWDETLTNDADPGDGGDCVEVGGCTTTTVTPPYTQLQVLKVDLETSEPLAGAEFSLFKGEAEIATAVSGDDGIALFDVKLQPGEFTVQETKAPEGYDLPINGGDVVTVTIDEPEAPGSNFVENGVMAAITFADPARGQLAMLPKEQYERDALGLLWEPSDGEVEFGDEIRYVVPVESEGEKLFHDVTLTDYVPGWNPADVTTAPAGTKADLVVDSITCGGGLTCTSEFDPATGKITWKLTETGQDPGVFDGDAAGFVEFVVRMPDIPGTSPIKTPGTVFAAALWNQAYLDWDQQDLVEEEQQAERLTAAALVAPTMVHHTLASNEVVVAANQTLPPGVVVPPPGDSPPVAAPLPNTGGPDRWLLLAGLVLLLGGATLVGGDRMRRRRS